MVNEVNNEFLFFPIEIHRSIWNINLTRFLISLHKDRFIELKYLINDII